MDAMEYYTRRLQCGSGEKDACLKTVEKLYHLRNYIRQNGVLAAEVLAETEPDPFYRACLLDFAQVFREPEELERRYTQYLMAGDYQGGPFLNAVLIAQGLTLLARYDGAEEEFGGKDWGELLGEALRGYFGVEYREKVNGAIRQAYREEHPPKERLSLLPEFDRLTGLTPRQRDWLVQNTAARTLCLALKLGGTQVSEFLMEGMEDREQLEQDLNATANVRRKDVEAAQLEMLERAKEAKTCM